MIEQLFGSKTRVKLLKMFYSNPNRPFYVREITRKIDEQINSVRRELGNLLSIGIISSDGANNRLYYEVNQTYEFYKPLHEIFGGDDPATAAVVLESDGKDTAAEGATNGKKVKADPVVADLLTVGNIEFALYTGQFTRDESSGIDMLIVGDVNQTKVQKFITGLEEREKKEIRYVVMPPSEFKYRREVKDRFIASVMASKQQILIDKRPKEEE